MSKIGGSDSKNPLYCSFCGKSQHEVRKLIAGPTVFICDECVELCMDIIDDLFSSPARLLASRKSFRRAAGRARSVSAPGSSRPRIGSRADISGDRAGGPPQIRLDP